MDVEKGESSPQHSNFEDRSSFEAKYYYHQSIDRHSSSNRAYSISKKHTMVEVMEIEALANRNSDIMNNFIEEKRQSSKVRSSNKSQEERLEQKKFLFDEEVQLDAQQFRRSGKQTTYHECQCRESCLGANCPCSLFNNQLCIKGLCCYQCIEKKYALFTEEAEKQPQTGGCLCKNSKCLKLYCRCYQSGNKCNQKCKCQDCHNTRDGLYMEEKKRQEAKKLKKLSRKNNHMNGLKALEKNYVFCNCRPGKCDPESCRCKRLQKHCGQFCCELQRYRVNSEDSQDQQRKQRYARHDNQDSIQKYFEEESYDHRELNKNIQFEPFTWNNK